MNLYDILGVDENATKKEIKSAWRKSAQQHHPDKGGDEERFRLIQRAWEILGNDSRRKLYDETGTEDDVSKILEQRMTHLFAQSIEQRGTEGDLISSCRDKVQEFKRKLYRERESLRSNLVFHENRVGRVSSTSVNMYSTLLESKIQSIRDELDRVASDLVITDLMIAELKSYKDERPEAVVATSYVRTGGVMGAMSV